MHLMPHTTIYEADGPVCTMALGGGCEIRVMPSRGSDRPVAGETGFHGTYYEIAERSDGDTFVVRVRNVRTPRPEDLDRDDTWRRRLELARVLPGILAGRVPMSASEMRHVLPLSLLVPSYKEAFPEGTPDDDISDTFFHNTQRRLDAVVAAYMVGQDDYDAAVYADRGAMHPDYSHLRHMGWIYAQQFRAIQELLAECGPEPTIVDLGTGGGHFLLCIAAWLSSTGPAAHVRLIGIDDREADMRRASRSLFGADRVNATFVVDDVTRPGFADQLRRYHPDIVVANHVIEHLPGDVQNRYLDDWLLAARVMLSVSVPLGDDIGSSISDHHAQYTAQHVVDLSRAVEIRAGFAVEARDVHGNAPSGLCLWVKPRDVIDRGGFAGDTVSLRPNPVAIPAHPLLEDFDRPFDPYDFGRTRRAAKIGDIREQATFQEPATPRQLRQLLVKMPGTDVVLPRELGKFTEAVQIVIDHNKAANNAYDESYAYLNVFQGRTMFSSYRGLSLNCHTDQMQSLHAGYAFAPDWSYIVSDGLPTMLFAQPFDISDALRRAAAGETVNLYDYFTHQASIEYLYRTDNFGIYLLSPYVVHSAAVADQDIHRVFMKVAFSTKRFFDNRELRRNPAFDNREWYECDTVGYADGWFSHAHWNERFVKDDLCPGWTPTGP